MTNIITHDYHHKLNEISDLSEDDKRYIDYLLNKSSNLDSYDTVNGSVNGTYKSGVTTWLNQSKLRSISRLKKCNSETSFIFISSILQEIFSPWPFEKEGHWLWVAQTYTVRVINWVLTATIKEYLRGGIKKTPAHYFTYRIRRRSKRKV